MSKCREEFDKLTPEDLCNSPWFIYQAAWNARGKRDAEICRDWGNARKDNYGGNALRNYAEAIEQENEK